jgi:hypothetical protein
MKDNIYERQYDTIITINKESPRWWTCERSNKALVIKCQPIFTTIMQDFIRIEES